MKSYSCAITLRHGGCFSEASEKFPGLRMVVLDARLVNQFIYYNRAAFVCPDMRYLEKYVRRVRSHPNVKEMRMVHRFRAGEFFVGIADIYAKNASASIRSVLNSVGRDVVVHPNIEHSGLEHISITTSDKAVLKDFYARVDGACEILKMAKREFSEDRFKKELERELLLDTIRHSEEFSYLFSLTRQQRRAIRTACAHGGVRGSKMKDMAGAMGVAPSTFRQHLDSGLFKLMPLISKVVSSLPSEDSG